MSDDKPDVPRHPSMKPMFLPDVENNRLRLRGRLGRC